MMCEVAEDEEPELDHFTCFKIKMKERLSEIN